MQNSIPYFSEPETLDRLTALRDYDHLTVVTGAGWSADWGIPRWRPLMSSLLQQVVQGVERSNENSLAFANAILETHGLIGAASIVRESFDAQSFERILRMVLYRQRVGDAGSAAFALANLYFIWRLRPGSTFTLITTNYDTSIETALRHGAFASARTKQGVKDVLTVVDGVGVEQYVRSEMHDAVPVFHLHGALPFNARLTGDLVFSEEDYVRERGQNDWHKKLFRWCLGQRKSACLFVGMSLTDPNVLRLLFHFADAKTRADRFVFLPEQADPVFPSGELVRRHVHRASRKRLERLRMTRVSPDFHGQVPQFLNELAACRSASSAEEYRHQIRYANRLEGWRHLMEEDNRINLDEDIAFAHIQRVNHSVLQATRALLYDLVGDVRDTRHVKERFALQLWARNPHSQERGLEVWGSSEKAWLERATILKARIQRDSDYNAVQAFCSGELGLKTTGKPGSRWQVSQAMVISLNGRSWMRLPVGVIVLESNYGLGELDDRTCLIDLDDGLRHSVVRVIRVVGEFLLTPGVRLTGIVNSKTYAVSKVFRSDDALLEALRSRLEAAASERRPEFSRRSRATFGRSALTSERSP